LETATNPIGAEARISWKKGRRRDWHIYTLEPYNCKTI